MSHHWHLGMYWMCMSWHGPLHIHRTGSHRPQYCFHSPNSSSYTGSIFPCPCPRHGCPCRRSPSILCPPRTRSCSHPLGSKKTVGWRRCWTPSRKPPPFALRWGQHFALLAWEVTLVGWGYSWAHGTSIHKESSPRFPAASLRPQLWSQFLSCTLGHRLVGPDDDSFSPGASLSCVSLRDQPCQVADSMLSTPGQRHISAAFFLSHCLSLSVLQPREAVVSLGSAPPLPSILPQAYWDTGWHWKESQLQKGYLWLPTPSQAPAELATCLCELMEGMFRWFFCSPHLTALPARWQSCSVGVTLSSTTETAGEEMIHMACENKGSSCSQKKGF